MNTKIISYSFILNFLFIIFAGTVVLNTWEKHLDSNRFSILIYDGKALTVKSEGQTVQAVLKLNGISLNKTDAVSPSLMAPAPPGGRIKITRVDIKTENEEKVGKIQVIKKTRLILNLRPVELLKVRQNIKRLTIKNTYINKFRKKREVTAEHSFTKTFYILDLLDKKGKIEKQYDLSKCRKMKMSATAYFPGDPLAWKDGTETLLGLKMQRGIVAVDPKVIHLRTRVFIPGYGYGYAGDTGSAIKGRKIDLGFNDGEEDKNWIHKPVTVYILERNQTW